MYGVVEIAGHQYCVRPGDLIDVNLLENVEGSVAQFDKVLFVGGSNPIVGLPVVAGAKVTAKIIRHDRDRKVIVSTYKKAGKKVKKGHRQHYTALLITELCDGKGNVAQIDKESKEAKKYL